MVDLRHVAVIDIGKTNAKLALVDLHNMNELAVLSAANQVLPGPPYPHYDSDALWRFILGGLRRLNNEEGINGIIVTAHGASAALIGYDGALAAPILDYEHDGPDSMRSDYYTVRPAFTETGSPRLPLGLNLGAQLYWQFTEFPDIAARTASILTYPQYWAYRLSGVLANEMTSLGCHTDLWCPREKRYSSLVTRMGWQEKMAPLRKATEKLGPILPSVAEATGLLGKTSVYCGIHDSNASLYSHLVSRKPPFSVLATGTWVIAMAVGGVPVTLDPARDTLINVNAFGDPVASARFMGGREFDLMTKDRRLDHDDADLQEVLAQNIMLLPAVEARSGPFQGRQHRWTVPENALTDGQCFVATSFYLALMSNVCLRMIGAHGPVLVEGPFARNACFLDMLSAVTARDVFVTEENATGTSIGAARLTAESTVAVSSRLHQRQIPLEPLKSYAQNWSKHVAA